MKKWKTIRKGDYLYAKITNHPNATKNGYVLEHRYVVECALGRYLLEGEVVHHINGDKHDNRLDNLKVMSRRDHTLLHKRPLNLVKFVCPNCGVTFYRRSKGKAEVEKPKCSRKCNGEYLHKVRNSSSP